MKKKKETQNQKGMTRREFIVTTGAATGAALVTASIGPFVHTTMAKGGTLKVCSYGGSYQESQRKALIQPFADKFGVKIIEESGPDIAKVKAQVDNKSCWSPLIPMSLTSTESTSKPSVRPLSAIFSGPLHWHSTRKRSVVRNPAPAGRISGM